MESILQIGRPPLHGYAYIYSIQLYAEDREYAYHHYYSTTTVVLVVCIVGVRCYNCNFWGPGRFTA